MLEQQKKLFSQKNPHSMTGFGRGHAASSQTAIQVEIKSLNSKYLEIRPKIPKIFSAWEPILRNKISRFLRRGAVEVMVNYQVLDPTLIHPINEATLQAYINAIQHIAEKLDIPSGLDLTSVLRLPGALSIDDGLSFSETDKASIEDLLDSALDEALLQLIEMRSSEGQAIIEVFTREISLVREKAQMIRELSPNINVKLQIKLKERVENYLREANKPIDESRFLQELAYYVDRSDVTEELDRLQSHANQFYDLIANKTNFVLGKQLDFLVQEMLREINTIGSKSDDLRVTNLVMDMKLSVDRAREQMQNLE